jgi:uncharacterized protein YggE
MQMKKSIILFKLLVTAVTCWSQVSGNENYNQIHAVNNLAKADDSDNEISLAISGLFNVKADAFVAFFNVTQVGKTAESTDSTMVQRIRKFKLFLQKAGLDSSGVTTDMISFVPKYDFKIITKIFSKTYNEVPDGFELQKNVIILYKNPEDINTIVTAAANAEIYDLVKVDYFLTDLKKQYDQLRIKSLEAFKEKVKTYELIGFRLDTMKKSFDEDYGTNLPHNRYSQFQAVARPSINALNKDITGPSAKVRSADHTNSRYYNAIAYDEYDVVLNPIVNEPVVQLTYQIKVKYYDSKSDKNNFLFVGSNGQIQKFDLTGQ